MALIINPDGTVTTVEADYDRYGNLREKINSKLLNEQTIEYNTNIDQNRNFGQANSPAPRKKTPKVKTVPPKKMLRFISTNEVDMFFKDKIASRKEISTAEYIEITDHIPQWLKGYFISKYRSYIGTGVKSYDDLIFRSSFKKSKNKKKKNKNKAPHVAQDVKAAPLSHPKQTHTGHSLGEIASFSSLHKRTPDENMVNGRYLGGASRNPKYGYARDRFGRVQERDSFNEERRNEFYTASKHQNNYDYSSYDSNDDHDGAYNDWE